MNGKINPVLSFGVYCWTIQLLILMTLSNRAFTLWQKFFETWWL